MITPKFDVNSLHIASPCSVGWETMTGDERKRHCQTCGLNIYNISAMRVDEVEHLLNTREDRTCIRLFRRADGTVLTRDCPVGLRGYRKRMTRFAGATFAAILGLFSIGFGQKGDETSIDAAKSKMVRISESVNPIRVKGVVIDPMGAVIPNATILLFKNGEKIPVKTHSDESGEYQFTLLSSGKYRIEVPSVIGFKKHVVNNIKIEPGRLVDVTIELALTVQVMGMLVLEEAPADMAETPMLTTLEMRDRQRF